MRAPWLAWARCSIRHAPRKDRNDERRPETRAGPRPGQPGNAGSCSPAPAAACPGTGRGSGPAPAPHSWRAPVRLRLLLRSRPISRGVVSCGRRWVWRRALVAAFLFGSTPSDQWVVAGRGTARGRDRTRWSGSGHGASPGSRHPGHGPRQRSGAAAGRPFAVSG